MSRLTAACAGTALLTRRHELDSELPPSDYLLPPSSLCRTTSEGMFGSRSAAGPPHSLNTHNMASNQTPVDMQESLTRHGKCCRLGITAVEVLLC